RRTRPPECPGRCPPGPGSRSGLAGKSSPPCRCESAAPPCSTLLSFHPDFLSVSDRCPAGERDQPLAALETLLDLDLTLDVASRGHRGEDRAPVHDAEHARTAADRRQRGLRDDDARLRLAALRRRGREVDPRRKVG